MPSAVRARGESVILEHVYTERRVRPLNLYIREVDPYAKIFTGMTRDGAVLIESGEVAGGVRNFRFNQSLLEMLSNVE